MISRYAHLFFFIIYFACVLFFFPCTEAKLLDLTYDMAVHTAQKGNWDLAKEKFKKLMVERSQDLDVLYDSGVASFKTKDFLHAKAYFKAVSEKENVSSQLKEQALFNLGNTNVELNDLQEALKNYEFVLKINPENKDAKHNLEIVKKLLEQKKEKQEQEKKRDQEQQQQQEQKKEEQKKQDKQDKSSEKQEQEKKRDQEQQQQQEQKKEEQDKQDKSSEKQEQEKKRDQRKQKERPDQDKQDKEREEPRSDTQRSDDAKDEQRDKRETPKDDFNNKGGEQQQKDREKHDQKPDQKRDEKQTTKHDKEDKTKKEKDQSTSQESPQDESPQDESSQDESSQDESSQESQKSHGSAQEEKDLSPLKIKNMESKRIDERTMQILQKAEERDKEKNKELMKATIGKTMTGKYGQNRW